MRYIRPTFGGAILAALLSIMSSPAQAAGEIATSVSIEPLETLSVGADASIVVTLTTQLGGALVVDEPITLTIDGTSRPRRWTDAAGMAIFDLPRDLRPGEHEVVATYAGRTNAFLGATARTVVEIVPYELVVETTPPLPGMVFDVDGTRFQAGPDGVARVGLDRLGVHRLSVVTDAYQHPHQRVEFSRWSNETFGPTIDIRVPLGARLQAGFDVSYQASQVFVDPHGGRVDEDRIEEVVMRSSIGASITNRDGRPRWYKASRTVRRPTGLEQVPIRYTVEKVIVDGANVVNVGQQRFDLEPGDAWPIELLLYSVRMVPNDALFGWPVGEAVLLTFPSGSTTRIEAVDDEFAADGLARGMYSVALADAPGWSPVTPVALSRDQEVRVRVVTYVDVAVVVLLGLSAALGLLHVGRPHLAPAAVAGAKVFASAVRSPKTIGAFVARRRAAARSRLAQPVAVPETAPAAVMTREFVLPPVRTGHLLTAVKVEPVSAHQRATPSPGAVPLAQIMGTSLGKSFPAAGGEAAPPHPPPLAIVAPAVDIPAPVPQRAQSVLVPNIAVAKPLTIEAVTRARRLLARSAATTIVEPSSGSASIRDEPTQPREIGSRDVATAKKRPSGKARRSKDAPKELAPPAGPLAGRKHQPSRKRSPEPSSNESVTEPRKRTPPRADAAVVPGVPKKRAGTTTRANTAPLEPRRYESVTEPQKRTLPPADAAVARTPKKRAGAPTKANLALPKPRGAKGSAGPPASRISESTSTQLTSAQDQLAAAKATKTRGAKPNPVTPRDPRVPKIGAPSKTGAESVGARRAKSRSATNPRSLSEATPDAIAKPGIPEAADHNVSPLPAPSEQTMTPFSATLDPNAPLAPLQGAGSGDGPGVTEMDAPVTAAERIDSSGLLGFSRLEAADPRGNDVETTPSAGYAMRVVPPRSGQPDRQPRPRGAALVCAGCRTPAKPGARFCRRCGGATAVGELERERLS